MKFLSKLKLSTRKAVALGVVAASILGLSLLSSAQAQNVSFNSPTDCDHNAVITGGALSVNDLVAKYNSGSTCSSFSSSAKAIHDVYNAFGISASDVSGMAGSGTTVLAGKVDKAGNVYDANGNVVATGAETAGMDNISGSTAVTSNGTTFYKRPPSVSFVQNSLDAYVVMVNGQFSFAILASCGNPVNATPKVGSAHYQMRKEVITFGRTGYTPAITVAPGTKVTYRIVVDSTGSAPVNGLIVRDNQPAHVTFIPGSLKLNGNTVATGNFFSTGYPVGSLAPGTSAIFTYEAYVGQGETATQCTAGTFTNLASTSATNMIGLSDTAAVTETCAPPQTSSPTYSCNSLSGTGNGAVYNFTAAASATNGAVITGYRFTFGDGASVDTTTPTTSHTYAPGTYTASVAALVSINGAAALPTTSNSCQTTASVSQPQTPSYACTGLTQLAISRTDYNFTAAASATNGAVITGYRFTFGDGASVDTTTPTTSHTYAPGTYTASVAALVSINGAAAFPATSNSCQTTVTVATAPTAECTGLKLDIDAPTRTVHATATVVLHGSAALNAITYDFDDGSTVVMRNDLNTVTHTYKSDGSYIVKATVTFRNAEGAPASVCQAPVSFKTTTPLPPSKPTTLVNTGAGSTVAVFAAVSALAATAYNFVIRRRLSQN